MIAIMEAISPCALSKGAPEKEQKIFEPERDRPQISVLENLSPCRTRLHVARSPGFPSEDRRGFG
jgi:hypothetical protein